MNFFSMFEDRIAGVFGTSPQGYTEPFSFKKLAKRAVKEMENETYVIDGVDTAPALFTILVSTEDDAVMRALYSSLTTEISQLAEAHAQKKGYVFVGQPLVRFMVDPSLRNGKFSVFAENVDARTLNRLRSEEASFLGQAAEAAPVASAMTPTPRGKDVPRTERRASPAAAAQYAPQPITGTDAGLDVLPANDIEAPVVLSSTPDAYASPVPVPQPAEAEPVAQAAQAAAPRGKSVPLVNPRREASAAAVAGAAAAASAAKTTSQQATPAAPAATCMLIDRQSGRTYQIGGPSAVIGRERSAGGVVLHDPNVSRRHAELSHDGTDWRIRDLGSTNGTLVNDVDVDDCILRSGDLVTLGLTNLEFREN